MGFDTRCATFDQSANNTIFLALESEFRTKESTCRKNYSGAFITGSGNSQDVNVIENMYSFVTNESQYVITVIMKEILKENRIKRCH